MLRASLGQCGQFTVAFRVQPKIIIRRKWRFGLSLDQSQDKMTVPMIFVGEHLTRNGVRNPYPLMVVHNQSLHSGTLPLLQVLARTFSPHQNSPLPTVLEMPPVRSRENTAWVS